MLNPPVVRLVVGATLLVCALPAAAAPAPAGVVRVFCNGEAGAGIVHVDRDHVLTAYAIVRSGRPAEIVFSDGRTVDAETLTVDRENGLALLKLDAAAAVDPPAIQVTAGAVGDTLMGWFPARAPGTDRAQPPARVPGSIVAIGKADLRVALPTTPDTIGAPVLDSTGKVVGLVRSTGAIVDVTPAAHFSAVVAEAAGDPDASYWGQNMLTLRAGWMMRADGDGISHGPRISMDLLAYDRFGLTARMGILGGDAPGGTPDFLAGPDTIGMVADVELNGRFGITASAPLQLVAGLGVTQMNWSTHGHILDGEDLVKTRVDGDLVRPYARLGLGISDLVELEYSFELDHDDPARSAHRFGLSIGF